MLIRLNGLTRSAFGAFYLPATRGWVKVDRNQPERSDMKKEKKQQRSLSLPPSLISQLEGLAEKEERSFNQMVERLLRKALSQGGEV